MAGERQEHVVQVGALDGHPGDRIVIDPVQEPAQGRDPVVGHPQREQLGIGSRLREYGGHLGQPSRVGELHLHAPARHPALQLGGCSLGDDPAAVEHPHPVGQLVGLVEVLRGQQHRHTVGDQLPHDLPHLSTAARVQPRGRLVEEDQPRRADQGHRQVQPALHPTGVRLGPTARRVRELEPLQQVVDDGLGASCGRGGSGRPSASGSRGRCGTRRSPRTARSRRWIGVPDPTLAGRRTRRRGSPRRRP